MAKQSTSTSLDTDRSGGISSATGTAGTTGTQGSSGRFGSSGARARAASATQKASQQINSAPLVAVGAGAALGAVLGAVLPTSRREKELLRPLGTRLTTAGTGAVERARDMSKQKFDEMAGDKVREFLGVGSGSGSNA